MEIINSADGVVALRLSPTDASFLAATLRQEVIKHQQPQSHPSTSDLDAMIELLELAALLGYGAWGFPPNIVTLTNLRDGKLDELARSDLPFTRLTEEEGRSSLPPNQRDQRKFTIL